jgi:uridylate kinase
MNADDIRQLSTQYNNGGRFVVIAAGSAQVVGTREEANALVSANAPAVAFSVRDLIGGVYDDPNKAAEAPAAPYRSVGTPYGSETA